MQRGDLLAEIDLCCRAEPLKRGRKSRHNVNQPLDNQTAMIEQLALHSYLKIDVPIIVDIRCGYMKFKRNTKVIVNYDVDNLLKGILDNLQRMWVITNDRLVLGACIVKHEASDDHIHIEIYKAKDY